MGQRKIADYVLHQILPINVISDELNSYFIPLKGHIDEDDNNYELLKKSGFRVEIKPTNPSDITDLYLMKNTSGNYYLYNTKNKTSISDYIRPVNGYQDITKSTWSSIEFQCKVYIEDATYLQDFSNTTDYIHIVNSVVSNISTENNIKTLVLNSYANNNNSICEFTNEYKNKLDKISVYNFTTSTIEIPNIPANNAINLDITVPNVKSTSYINISFLYGVLSSKDYMYSADATGDNKVTITIRNFSDTGKTAFSAAVKLLIIN